MKRLVSFAMGALFGVGLCVSGMTIPSKVIGFLDVFGRWDPTLMGVMATGIACFGMLAWLARRRGEPVLEKAFHLTELTEVDARLVSGAAIFGVGWGLCGVCPGPAIVSVGSGQLWPFVFVLAMAAGARAESLVSAPGRRLGIVAGAD